MLAHRWAKPPPALDRNKSLPSCNVEVWKALHRRLFLERMMAMQSAITELSEIRKMIVPHFPISSTLAVFTQPQGTGSAPPRGKWQRDESWMDPT